MSVVHSSVKLLSSIPQLVHSSYTSSQHHACFPQQHVFTCRILLQWNTTIMLHMYCNLVVFQISYCCNQYFTEHPQTSLHIWEYFLHLDTQKWNCWLEEYPPIKLQILQIAVQKGSSRFTLPSIVFDGISTHLCQGWIESYIFFSREAKITSCYIMHFHDCDVERIFVCISSVNHLCVPFAHFSIVCFLFFFFGNSFIEI